ncbi:MAG: dephospho-CoA kinase, partial [Pirellulales bacterium]|nr:dephospho-CoA kinase [Pirellulales bacterium]
SFFFCNLTLLMHVFGLVGGIASGKSAVAKELAALGAVVLDADQAAHKVLNLPEVRQALLDRWGESIVLESGEVDRSAIAERVFADSPTGADDLDFLEKTLHPKIRTQFESELAARAKDGTAVAVIDAPLLLEAGWRNLCDSVIFVDCPYETRLQRALQRNWTSAQFAAREAAQMPIKEKRQSATHTILNTGPSAELGVRVRALWDVVRPDTDKT